MPALHHTAYPRLQSSYTSADLIRLFTPTIDERVLASRVTTGATAPLGFLVLLKTFQLLGYFLPLRSVPQVIVQHIAQQLEAKPDATVIDRYDASGTRRRHVAIIRDYLQVHPYDRRARRQIIRTIAAAAAAKEDLADLINVGIAELVKLRYELPGYTTLEKIAQRVRTAVYRGYYRRVGTTLRAAIRARIDTWFVVHAGTQQTPWQQMKADAGHPSRIHLHELADGLHWFETQAIPITALTGVPDVKVKHFAAEARSLDAARMTEMQEAKRYTLAVALYASAAARTRDDLAEMLVKRVQQFHKQSKEALTAYRESHVARTDALIATLRDVITAFTKEGTVEERMAALSTVLGDDAPNVLDACTAHLAYASNNYYPFLWPRFKSHRAVIMRILSLLVFQSTSQDTRLERAIAFLRMHARRNGDYLTIAREKPVGKGRHETEPLLDLSWIPDGWWRLVTETPSRRDIVLRVNRRQFTVCVLTQLVAALKTGDLAIQGSDRYADVRRQQISWETYHAQVASYGQLTGLPVEGSAFVAHVQQWLADNAHTADAAFPDNPYVRMHGTDLVVQRLTARALPKDLAPLQQMIADRANPVNILDALLDTIRWADWTRHFGPLSGFDAKIDDLLGSYLVTTFCYGCQLGPAQTARALDTVDRRHIAWINQRHISVDALDRAIELLIHQYEHFALPKLWGSPKRAAADGTKWEMYEHNLLAEQHIRYGGYGGIGYYHVADTYIAIFSNLIACGAWEGTYLLDFFGRYMSTTQPDTLHADTQGQTEPLFGLAYLLGITLMPRIRNWQERTFYRPSPTYQYQHIDAIFNGIIDWNLIATHLPDMLRVVLSIRAGILTPSTLVRTLSSANNQSHIYRAFRELGRAVRTGRQLHYLTDIDLRHIVQSATNKVEAFNRFAKWVGFGSGGVLTDNNREEQLKLIKYNHLVANCLILYNTAMINRILHDLKGYGNDSCVEQPFYISAVCSVCIAP